MPSRLRILISAYGCSPGRGSEPGVGWNWSQQVARIHEVWVLTPESERRSIENAAAIDVPATLHFVHCDLPPWVRPSNDGTTIRYYLHYYLWQICAFLTARRLNQRFSFDFIHHLTLGAHWAPSFLSLLPVPFIWGPLGGGETIPAGLASSISLKGRVLEALRSMARFCAECDPFVKLTARRADLILAKTEDTAKRVRRLGGRRVEVFSEAGLSKQELDRLASMTERSAQPFRLLSLGRLVYWKGFELGIRAFGQVSREFPDMEFWIVGDGPERRRLMRVAEKLNVLSKMKFLGELPRAQALGRLMECNVLVHPSLHDSGGWVCVEAMAAGKPVICLDAGGPGVQVTDETGFKIPPFSLQQCVGDIAQAIRKLANDENLAAELGLAGRHHVAQHFAWRRKGVTLGQLYPRIADNSKHWLLLNHDPQPSKR